uniref:Uncharacterized protein n=1 Tax=Arundo donax TaxID=35708 RepID=A0A0A9A921_ARUDO
MNHRIRAILVIGCQTINHLNTPEHPTSSDETISLFIVDKWNQRCHFATNRSTDYVGLNMNNRKKLPNFKCQ